MTGLIKVGDHFVPESLEGTAMFEIESPAALSDIYDDVAGDILRAREDIKAFFELVMVEETTRKPLKCLPHQRVFLDFVMAHNRSIVKMPIGSSKTFLLAVITLFFLGTRPTSRGLIVCASQAQAEKVLSMVRAYIEESEALKMVFPNLRRSPRKGDPWTQTKITVLRPPGIRDASLAAVGVDADVAGARLNWVVVDDILSRENTATKEQRDKVYDYLDSTVFRRLDPVDSKAVVTNTPWSPDDVMHRLAALGWPTLTMSAYGDVEVTDDDERKIEAKVKGVPFVPWDSPELRPARGGSAIANRLAAHDPDPREEKTLWPAKYTQLYLAKEQRGTLPHRFNQLFKCIVRDDATARCRQEWVDKCKKNAREKGYYTLQSEWHGSDLTFTGVDLAVSEGEENDMTAFFTFVVLPGGFRLLLDLWEDRMSGPDIKRKLFDVQRRYNSILRVENNAAQQYLLQFALEEDVSLPLRPHTTGRAKAHPEYGVEGIFVEIFNGAWLFPNDHAGRCPPMVQRFIDYCLNYEPSKHTPDLLMAGYFAREQAREWGCLAIEDTDAAKFQSAGVATQLMAR